MKLTCLNTGKGYHFPACHLLQMCGVRILLECPLDLSSLELFLPVSWSVRGKLPSVPFSPQNCSFHDASQPRKQRRTEGVGNLRDSGSLFKYCEGSVLIDAEPWYKTADLHMWDLSLIDVVLVSSPAGMLGLPFLTRNKCFSAKIYATEATAKVGQLMMEDLLTMHSEFVKLYGPPSCMLPFWLDCRELEAAPVMLRERILGKDGTDIGNWHPLYSAADVKVCMERVHLLRFAEEICYNGMLIIKPISSGLEIGASNWIVTGPRRNLTYISGSIIDTGHAKGLDIPLLQGTDLILFSDFSSLNEMDNLPEENVTCIEHDKSDRNDPTHPTVPKFRYKFPVYRHFKPSTVISSAHEMQSPINSFSSASPGLSSVGMLDSNKSQAVGMLRSSPVNSNVEKGIGIESDEVSGSGCVTPVEREKFVLICNSTRKAVEAGGSVLIPISRTGSMFQLVEEISSTLNSAGLWQVPIFYISSNAEETLAFANTIPEWLNKQRQEKLYAGEALFGHIGLLMDKRLHSFSALHCQQLVDAWQEPCIVFASHWSLRTGPSVHLLHRWHQNPNCLLVMVEAMLDIDVVLSPFKPMTMQLLQCPFLSGLRFNEIASVMKKLQPKLVLFPEALQKWIHKMALKEQSVLFYCKGQTLRIPCLKDEIEVDMATDLAFQLRPKQVGQEKSTVTKLKAELHREDGRFLLKSAAPSCQSSTLSNQQCRKGVVNSDNLLLALRDRGLCASIEDDVTSEMVSKDEKENDRNALQFIVKISSPSKAIIEIRDKDISIRTDDVAICDNIFNALDSIMHVT